MRKFLKALKVLFLAMAVLAFAAVGLAVYLTVTEYRPAAVESVPVTGSGSTAPRPGDSLRVLSWNIGYGALGDEADFFLDGGKQVYTADEARLRENLTAQIDFVRETAPDLCFLQEVDTDSDRSLHIDETALFREAFPGCAAAFAVNYRAFVPVPLPPVGRVEGGLLTLSTLPIREAERAALPNAFTWPVRVCMLKRCLLVTRIPLDGTDKELVAINLHIEAYGKDVNKAEQTAAMLRVLNAEAEKGNYVIAGGDFNQSLSESYLAAHPVPEGLWNPPELDAADFPGFTLRTDDRVPTCRSLDRVLAGADRESFQYYVIDGFLVSANVRIDSCETQDLGFVHADHNPLLLQVTLLKEE